MNNEENGNQEEIQEPIQESPKQAFLFEEFKDHDHKEHWVGMPEFISNDCNPFRTIMIHFEDKEAVEIFKKFIGQTITEDTKYLYFPKVNEKRCTIEKEWIDG